MSLEVREQGLKAEGGADDAARLARNLTRADVKEGGVLHVGAFLSRLHRFSRFVLSDASKLTGASEVVALRGTLFFCVCHG